MRFVQIGIQNIQIQLKDTMTTSPVPVLKTLTILKIGLKISGIFPETDLL